jgi:hypothetical protein
VHRRVLAISRVADAGEVGVLLPVLERLAAAGALHGVVGVIGSGGEVDVEAG